jgi:mitogen-activated protein kinase organizer 1
VTQVEFDGDLKLVASSIDGHLRHYDLRKGALTEDFVSCGIMKFAISTDQKLVALSCLDSKIRLMERSSG